MPFLPSFEVPDSWEIHGTNPYGMVRLSLLEQLLLHWSHEADDFDSNEFGGGYYAYVKLHEDDCLALQLVTEADQSWRASHSPFGSYGPTEWSGELPSSFVADEFVIVYVNDRGWPSLSDQSWLEDDPSFVSIRSEIATECYGDEESDEDAEEASEASSDVSGGLLEELRYAEGVASRLDTDRDREIADWIANPNREEV